MLCSVIMKYVLDTGKCLVVGLWVPLSFICINSKLLSPKLIWNGLAGYTLCIETFEL